MSTVMHEENYKTNLQLNIFNSGYFFVQQQTNLFIEIIRLFIKQSNINLTLNTYDYMVTNYCDFDTARIHTVGFYTLWVN